jgi:hypothetical protein
MQKSEGVELGEAEAILTPVEFVSNRNAYQVMVTVSPVAPSLYEPADTSWPAKIRP